MITAKTLSCIYKNKNIFYAIGNVFGMGVDFYYEISIWNCMWAIEAYVFG